MRIIRAFHFPKRINCRFKMVVVGVVVMMDKAWARLDRVLVADMVVVMM